MRLIDVETFKFEQFYEPSIPSYGILSHTWEGDEVSFHDFVHASRQDILNVGKYYKIRESASLAEENGLRYIWIDTCCIDKTSSAELQEAINSMYKWYQNSSACYVYLIDYEPRFGVLDLKACRWLTRGWTLQELIAPLTVIFYAKDWSLIGTKTQFSRECALATGIDPEILLNPGHLAKISVAEKMSWAAGRECTRIEDRAYSLMGLFSVNMPMLYGEGEKAFIRLQEEIMKSTFDMSIFAWRNPNADRLLYCGLVSPTPDYFDGCGQVGFGESFESAAAPYSVTNLGVQLRAELYEDDIEPDLYLLHLIDVGEKVKDLDWERSHFPLAISVKRLSPLSSHFARIDANALHVWRHSTEEVKAEMIYVRQSPIIQSSHATPRVHHVHLKTIMLEIEDADNVRPAKACLARVYPGLVWNNKERTLKLTRWKGGIRAGIFFFFANGSKIEHRRISLQFDEAGRRQIHVSIQDSESHLWDTTMSNEAMEDLLERTLEAHKDNLQEPGTYSMSEKNTEYTSEIRARVSTVLKNGRLALELDYSEKCRYTVVAKPRSPQRELDPVLEDIP